VSVSFSNRTAHDVAAELEEKYSVLARSGLHCSPLAHRTLGTFPGGTVRFGISQFIEKDDIDIVVEAVAEVAGR
jgi:selenocysteine lyase/cysteine desulfurase